MNYACRSSILNDGVEYTALTYACWNFSVRTVDLLLEHGARADLGNPLHKCVNHILLGCYSIDMYMQGYVMAMHLINRGAVIDLAEKEGVNAITNCLMNTALSTDNPVIISACRSIFTLILLENAIKIPDGNYIEVNFHEFSPLDFFDLQYIEMCTYLYENGYRIRQIEDATNSEEIKKTLAKKSKKLLTRIQEMKTWNLQRLCRRTVRKALGPPLTKKVPELPLPGLLKDYVYVELKFEVEKQ